MSSVSELLGQPERKWKRSLPATEAEISQLLASTEFAWPDEFLDLLRFSNGGEGELALPPLWFVLDPIENIISLRKHEFYLEVFPAFLFFGGNGGLEMIAFNLDKRPYPIVMIDPIAGTESAVEISPNVTEFINAIGFEYKEKCLS
jgi:hypothetical protein